VTTRTYDNTRRREQAAATRDRIVTAGSELLHGSSVRDWRALTVRAVAARAGVSERTVFRHFGDERTLRDAVLHRLEEEAGVEVDALELRDLGAMTARLFDHLASYPRPERPALDPTLTDARRRQQAALRGAVAAGTPGWSESERETVAAVLDVLWSVDAYERLVSDWRLDHAGAVAGVRWAVDRLTEALGGEAET
jgi:AcrR family transcriptional regulator